MKNVKIELSLDRANLMKQILLTGVNALSDGINEIRAALDASLDAAEDSNVSPMRKKRGPTAS